MTVKLTRMTVNLLPKAAAAMEETSRLLEISNTDVVNRALKIVNFIETQVAAGGKVFVLDSEGKTREMILL